MIRTPRRIFTQSDKLNKIDKDGKPTYISMNETKDILHLSDDGVKHYIIKRTIKAFKSGGKWYLNRDNVTSLARARTYTPRRKHSKTIER